MGCKQGHDKIQQMEFLATLIKQSLVGKMCTVTSIPGIVRSKNQSICVVFIIFHFVEISQANGIKTYLKIIKFQ